MLYRGMGKEMAITTLFRVSSLGFSAMGILPVMENQMENDNRHSKLGLHMGSWGFVPDLN